MVRPILVGVTASDAGPATGEVLAWAARDAQVRGLPLRLLHVVDPLAHSTFGLECPSEEVLHHAERVGREALEAASRVVLGIAPELVVERVCRRGPIVDVMREESGLADLLVVGAFRGAVRHEGGRVLTHLTAHAGCPVVVVREASRVAQAGPGAVVVGVDGSDESESALEFAARRAATEGAGLSVVHAVDAPIELWASADYSREIVADTRRRLEKSVSAISDRYPGLEVQLETTIGRPARALLDASSGARLLVVGSHGRGRFAGILLGSVSQFVVRHAACPVAVVRSHALPRGVPLRTDHVQESTVVKA